MKKFSKWNIRWNKESALIVILAGILCLVVVWPTGTKKSTEKTFSESRSSSSSNEAGASSDAVLNAYIENQEQRLKSLLERMDGVGKIQVMIRAKASKEYVVEKDVTSSSSTVGETDSQGGSRQSTDGSRSESSVYTKNSSGNEVPWVIQEIEPEIEGVVVAAEGGGNESIANEITQAVQVLFDIPIHKIKVVKMKGE